MREQKRSIAFSFLVCIIQTQTIVENISTKRTNIRNRVIVGRGRIKRRARPSSLCITEKKNAVSSSEWENIELSMILGTSSISPKATELTLDLQFICKSTRVPYMTAQRPQN